MRDHRGGFTLLEILMATAMTAVLAGSLYASLYIAFRAKESAMRSVESPRASQAAFEMLRQDIASAVVPTGLLAGPFVGANATVSPDSEGDTLSLHTVSADVETSFGEGDIRLVEYFCQVDEDANGSTLIRAVTTNLLSTRQVEPVQEVVCRGVKEFHLRYFDGTAWQDSWDSTTRNNVLPTAVEVTLELKEPTAKSQDQSGYRMTRVLLVPCGQAVPDETTDTAGGTS